MTELKLVNTKFKELENIISRASGVTVSNMRSHIRNKAFAEARSAVWYIAHDYMGYSYPDIAYIYNRDHTTVMSGVKRIRNKKIVADFIKSGVDKVCPELLKKVDRNIKQIHRWEFQSGEEKL